MENFIENSLRTESNGFGGLVDSDGKEYNKERLIHAQMGLFTEGAEFADALKKSIFYGKTLDVVNLKEELGDMLWYMAIAMDELDTDFETEMKRVVDKLKHRYPEKFTEDAAENRDLNGERKILEDDVDFIQQNDGTFVCNIMGSQDAGKIFIKNSDGKLELKK